MLISEDFSRYGVFVFPLVPYFHSSFYLSQFPASPSQIPLRSLSLSLSLFLFVSLSYSTIPRRSPVRPHGQYLMLFLGLIVDGDQVEGVQTVEVALGVTTFECTLEKSKHRKHTTLSITTGFRELETGEKFGQAPALR